MKPHLVGGEVRLYCVSEVTTDKGSEIISGKAVPPL